MKRRKKATPARHHKRKQRIVVRRRPRESQASAQIATPAAPPPPEPAAVAPADAAPAVPRGWERLTPTQRRVFGLVAAGRSTSQIAAELGASPHTVQAHRVHISVRLGLRGHNALQKFALARAASG